MDTPLADLDLELLIREPRSRWERSGLTPRQERAFNIVALLLVVLFASGWTYSIGVAHAESGRPMPSLASISSRVMATPLSRNAPPATAFLIDRFVEELAEEVAPYRGESGQVNVLIQEPGDTIQLPALPDSVGAGATLGLRSAAGDTGAAGGLLDPAQVGATPGIWNLVLQIREAVRPVPELNLITLVPLSERKGGRIGKYLIGTWPTERGRARANYQVPRGLVQVTPENRDVRVSEHLTLGDFLTKGQENVWPKYVALSPRLLDKLELTFQELERAGHPVEHVFVISGFRTPVYNASGGRTEGRGKLSRHMYGDAADVAIDNDRNGRMDDLNGDGRLTIADVRILSDAADRVERRYPQLVGGIGTYRPASHHGGFVHIDTRGYRARW